MEQLRRPGPAAVAPEQPGVRDPLDLGRLRRRQGVEILQPWMRTFHPGGGWSAPAQGRARHGPDGVPGPARHRDDVSGIGPAQAEPLQAIRHHARVRRLQEDRVSALPRKQAGRPQVAGPGGNPGVIDDVEAMQAGADARCERGEPVGRDRRHRLVHAFKVEFQSVRHRPGVAPFVPLGTVVVEVEKGRPPRQTGLDEAAGHDSRVQATGDFGDDPRVRRDQPCGRLVDDLDQRLRSIVPAIARAIEVAGPPERRGVHRGSDDSEIARGGGADPRQERPVVEKLHRIAQLHDRSPIDRDPLRQQDVEAFRNPVPEEDRAAAPPPDGVQLTGRRPQDRQPAVVRPPDEQIAAPPLPQGPQADLAIRPALADVGGERRPAPEPASQKDVTAMDLDGRQGSAGPEPERQVVDPERPPPARALEPPGRDGGGPSRLGVPAGRVDEKIGVAVRGRVAHRTRIGVKAMSRSTSSLRQTSSCCTQQ